MFNSEDLHRYRKQLKLPEWNLPEQLKLAESTLLVVGAGGLACGALPYLVSAGIGKIILIDKDCVDLSNLGRQVIYATEEVGLPKVEVAKRKLNALNPNCEIEAISENLDANNAHELIAAVDLVIDCTDNFTTRYLINDTCVRYDKPFVYAAIHSWEGLISVCNGTVFGENRKGPTYRCFFPEEPGLDEIPTCDEAGVLGFLPGILGILQAKEAIYYLVSWESPANGALGRFDANDLSFRFYKTQRTHTADQFSATSSIPSHEQVKELDVQMAQNLLNAGELKFILDVREPDEYELASLENSIQIPMHQIGEQISKIPKDQKGLVMCHHGMRSAYVIKQLQALGFQHLFNMKGGIDAWSIQIDPSIPRYY